MTGVVKVPAHYEYLNSLPLADLENELVAAQADLKEATTEVKSAQSYGGFASVVKVARRKQQSAREIIRNIKQILKERRYDI